MLLGIDIGGTTVKVGLVDNNKIVKKYAIETNPKTLIDDIIASFKEHDINPQSVHAIGCSVPGFIDHDKGIIKLSGNLGFKDYNFKKEFEDKVNREVYVVNDANSAALGEYWVGAGTGYKSIMLYTIGTGIGGGVVINSKLIFGSHGYAGELGHGGNFQDEIKCNCGLPGCIEPMSSAVGITRILNEELGFKTTVKDQVSAFINKDPKVLKAFRRALTPLARHIATMELAINPEVVIIGGGPSAIGQPLADFISELVKENQLGFIHESTPIKIATTGNDAGILGAAYWAMDNHINK